MLRDKKTGRFVKNTPAIKADASQQVPPADQAKPDAKPAADVTPNKPIIVAKVCPICGWPSDNPDAKKCKNCKDQDMLTPDEIIADQQGSPAQAQPSATPVVDQSPKKCPVPGCGLDLNDRGFCPRHDSELMDDIGPDVTAGGVPPKAAPADAKVKINPCPLCGHENKPGEAFCTNCGQALEPTAPAPVADKAAKKAPAPADATPPPAAPKNAAPTTNQVATGTPPANNKGNDAKKDAKPASDKKGMNGCLKWGLIGLAVLFVGACLLSCLAFTAWQFLPKHRAGVAPVAQATAVAAQPTAAATLVAQPTATPAAPTYTQTGPGRTELLPDHSFNTGEIVDLLGKKYLNEPGAVYYVVNKSSKVISLISVGGGLANSVDVDKLAFTELLGGCGPSGCAKVIFIIVSDNGTEIVTRTK